MSEGKTIELSHGTCPRCKNKKVTLWASLVRKEPFEMWVYGEFCNICPWGMATG